MCLVIDTCCLISVFDSKDKSHSDFVPVLNWIYPPGKGRVIYGGSKYKTELSRIKSLLPLFAELNRMGRTVLCEDAEVDEVADALTAKVADSNFNDEHLTAIVIISLCYIFCTHDRTSLQFLKI